jgi:serine/threonine protein phosphatase PrpC
MRTATVPDLDTAPALDVAAALDRGARDHQEDALATGMLPGNDAGFIVLADGMGGHSAGDVASRLVVETVTAALSGWLDARDETGGAGGPAIPQVLRQAADAANIAVRAHAGANPATRGMGATLLAAVADGTRLWWLSIGDSPLWLWRDGQLHRLNEVHSLAPQIDLMVEAGLMDAETGRSHPDRSCLTSVIYGADLARIDCPDRPVEMRPGDVVLAASDGIEFLGRSRIGDLLAAADDRSAARVAGDLMGAVRRLADPDQDNVALAVLRLADPAEARMAALPPMAQAVQRPATRNLWPFAVSRGMFGRLGPRGG